MNPDWRRYSPASSDRESRFSFPEGCTTMVIKPKTFSGISPTRSSSVVCNNRKNGDVALEKQVEKRIKQLGLWENKTSLESIVKERLHSTIEEDILFQAINRSRRKRPLCDRMSECANSITDLIRSAVINDNHGNKISYQVKVLMGLFTRQVTYSLQDGNLVLSGNYTADSGVTLQKEIQIEFPANVDVQRLTATFGAGVFTCEAPFHLRLQRSRSSGSVSSSALSQYSSVSDERSPLAFGPF